MNKYRVQILDTNLGKVSNHMSSKFVNFTKDVKEEGLDIKVESLVIQKQLSYQTQILGIDFVFLSISFVY